MNFKTFFLLIVLLISLGTIVSSKELVFPDSTDVTVTINLINGSGLWNGSDSGTELIPYDAALGLAIPALISCDTIDTDADGVMSCGTDATGAGEDTAKWTRENTTDYLGGFNISAFININDSIIYSWNTTWRDEGTGGATVDDEDVNLSMLDNGTVLRTGNLSDIGRYINDTTNITLYNYSVMLDNHLDLFQSNWGDDGWINWVSPNFEFNQSKFEIIYYSATQAGATAGTFDDSGGLNQTNHTDGNYDDNTFNFTEEVVSPGLDVRINFTDIDDFSQGVMRYKTSKLFGDYPIIQLWDYSSEGWEDYPVVGESSSFATITQPVFDDTNHIGTGDNLGIVQMRIYKSSIGNSNNHYYIDWIGIAKGFGVPSGQETDPYSIHINAINKTHFYYNQILYLNFTTISLYINETINISLYNLSVSLDNYFTQSSIFTHINTNFTSFNTSFISGLFNFFETNSTSLNASLNAYGWLRNNSDANFTNLLVKEPPAECPSGYFMTYTNMTTSICVALDISPNSTWWNELYDLRTDRYNATNFTTDYEAKHYYKKANLTLDYPNLDTDSTDDLDLPALDNNTVIRTANTTWWTTQYEAEIPTCAGGEYTTGDGSDLTCSTPTDSDTVFDSATMDIVNQTMFDNNTIVRAGNATFVTSQSVGGEVSGTIGNIVIDSGIHDDEYLGINTLYSNFKLENISNDTVGYSELFSFMESNITTLNKSWGNITSYQMPLTGNCNGQVLVSFTKDGTVSCETDDSAEGGLADTIYYKTNITSYLGEDGNYSLLRTVNISKDLAKSFSNFKLENVSNNTWNIGDVATPSDGDTTHISTADQIFDYIAGLNYITNAVSDLVNYFTKAQIFTHIGNNITSANASIKTYVNEVNISMLAYIDNGTYNKSIDLSGYISDASSYQLEINAWKILNLTNYFGDASFNNSVIRVSNITSHSLGDYNYSVSLDNYYTKTAADAADDDTVFDSATMAIANVSMLSNTSIVRMNTTISTIKTSIVNYNSTCAGFKFNNSANAGGLFSCMT